MAVDLVAARDIAYACFLLLSDSDVPIAKKAPAKVSHRCTAPVLLPASPGCGELRAAASFAEGRAQAQARSQKGGSQGGAQVCGAGQQAAGQESGQEGGGRAEGQGQACEGEEGV